MEPARTPQQVFTVVEGGSPGAMMRAARERMGLRIEDVCDRLKMLPEQIRAMESSSLDGLPPGGYARAFIKGYARFLGLDPEQIVDSMVALNDNRDDVAALPAMKVSPAVAAQRQADAEDENPGVRGRREPVMVKQNFGQLISEPSSDSNLVKYSLVALVIGLLVYVLVPASKDPVKTVSGSPNAPTEAPVVPPPVMAERIPAGQPGAVPAGAADSAFPPGTVMVPAQPAEPPAGGTVQVAPPQLVQQGIPQGATVSQAPAVPAPVVQQPQYQPSAAPTVPTGSAPAAAPVAGRSTSTPGRMTATTPSTSDTATGSRKTETSRPVTPAAAAPAAPAAPVYQQPAAVAPAPVASAPVASAAASGSTQRIRMSFSDRAYITIRDRDGHVLMAQLNAANTEQTIEGKPPFKVIIGNARAVRMEYKGRPYDLSVHTRDDIARFVME